AGELPLVKALHRVFAGASACRLHDVLQAWARGCELVQRDAATARNRFAISTATSAQSRPLTLARTSACSSSSQVRMPLAIGTPVSSCTRAMPAADSLLTISK